jgi:hypothetical protein
MRTETFGLLDDDEHVADQASRHTCADYIERCWDAVAAVAHSPSRYDEQMVSGPPGFVLALMVAGGAAMLTLIVVKLWPKTSDVPERLARRTLRAWNRFAGTNDAAK